MLNARKGFTLIERLNAAASAGIVASSAILEFGATRAEARLLAMRAR